MKSCVFCQIAKKEIPAKIVYENDEIICFLPKKIEVYGHTLIVPKKHYQNLYDIPPEILNEVVKTTKKLAQEYRQKIGATGVNLLHASGKGAQQSIFHFHFHLLPRFKNDGIDVWPKLPKTKIDNNKLYKRLRLK